MKMLKIEKPKYFRGANGFPCLSVAIAGRTGVILSVAVKRNLLAEGFAGIGSDFDGLLPPLTLPDATGRQGVVLANYTADAGVVALLRAFIAASDRLPFPPSDAP